VAAIELDTLADAHGRWRHVRSQDFGSDRLDIYDRLR
jgi:hypothetical protein